MPIANKPDTGQANLIKLTNWAKAERRDCLDKNLMYIFNMYTFNNLHQCMCGLNSCGDWSWFGTGFISCL